MPEGETRETPRHDARERGHLTVSVPYGTRARSWPPTCGANGGRSEEELPVRYRAAGLQPGRGPYGMVSRVPGPGALSPSLALVSWIRGLLSWRRRPSPGLRLLPCRRRASTTYAPHLPFTSPPFPPCEAEHSKHYRDVFVFISDPVR
jgi:hypothetical protein